VLGRSAGLSDEQIGALFDEPLPADLFAEEQRAIVTYSRASTRMEPITDEIYGNLARHFDTRQIMELWATVASANQVNRFHATFLTDVDDATTEQLGACPLLLPPTRSVKPFDVGEP
jgi:alkylhydroperoxidase family enzyme